MWHKKRAYLFWKDTNDHIFSLPQARALMYLAFLEKIIKDNNDHQFALLSKPAMRSIVARVIKTYLDLDKER